MTPEELDRLRRATAALDLASKGQLIMPEAQTTRALNIVQDAADQEGKTLEEFLKLHDSDRRIGQPEKDSVAAAAADLDETERLRFLLLVKRFERSYRKLEVYEKTNLPVLWLVAHDTAIHDVCHARALSLLNGSAEWDETTWRPR